MGGAAVRLTQGKGAQPLPSQKESPASERDFLFGWQINTSGLIEEVLKGPLWVQVHVDSDPWIPNLELRSATIVDNCFKKQN